MPGRDDCPLPCPFADDPETTCAAIRLNHPFCDSRHPGMAASVRKITLQLDGRWVEPAPEPSPPRAEPSSSPAADPIAHRAARRAANPYRAQIAAVHACPYGSTPSCGCAAKRMCWRFGRDIPLRECFECIPIRVPAASPDGAPSP